MRDRLAFALSAASFLFLLEALRALFGVLFAGVYIALFPEFDTVAMLLAFIPLAGLLLAALPPVRWLERDRLLGYAAIGAALLRIGLCLPPLLLRTLFSATVLACCGIFIVAATGSFSRRINAAGAATGIVLDQVLRLFGRSYDLTMRPQWVPAQLAIAAIVITIAIAFMATPEAEDDTDHDERLERRRGGLRLRGAISVGCILFLETTVVGMPEVAARITHVPYDAMGLVLVLAGAAAIGALLAGSGPAGRHRPAAVGLAGVGTLAAIVPLGFSGWPAALLIAVGHFALLVLLYRALAPAGGRRGGWVISVGLGVLVLLHALYGMTFFYAFTLHSFRDRESFIIAAAGVVLMVALALTPRPNPSVPRNWRRMPLMAVAVVLLALALRFSWNASPTPILPVTATTFSVATYNVHYGFNGEWRYDPEAIARVLEASGADVIALQEVPVGLPAAYGTDLALWLGRRLRMQSSFAPSINGLLGDAFLTRLPIVSFESRMLPPDTADRKQLGRLTVRAGRGAVTVFGTHLGVDDDDRRVQTAAAAGLIGSVSPAVFAGDFNAPPASATVQRIQAAGFNSVFDLLRQPHPPSVPARRPVDAIDYIFIRGLTVEAAQVLEATASDHRPVIATLRIRQ
ncbi:MAG: endonuclease/exonuclease/phosphatase family protein [Gemmatimonadota bacterium]